MALTCTISMPQQTGLIAYSIVSETMPVACSPLPPKQQLDIAPSVVDCALSEVTLLSVSLYRMFISFLPEMMVCKL